MSRREPVTCRTVMVDGTPVSCRGRGPMTDQDRAVVVQFTRELLARRRIVFLQPERPRRALTPRKLWAWAALGLPCREPVDGVRRCGRCSCCVARGEALRTWCP